MALPFVSHLRGPVGLWTQGHSQSANEKEGNKGELEVSWGSRYFLGSVSFWGSEKEREDADVPPATSFGRNDDDDDSLVPASHSERAGPSRPPRGRYKGRARSLDGEQVAGEITQLHSPCDSYHGCVFRLSVSAVSPAPFSSRHSLLGGWKRYKDYSQSTSAPQEKKQGENSE